MYAFDETGRRVYWLLQKSNRVIRFDRVCEKCGAYCPIGETMEYRVEVYYGSFTSGYRCFICMGDSG